MKRIIAEIIIIPNTQIPIIIINTFSIISRKLQSKIAFKRQLIPNGIEAISAIQIKIPNILTNNILILLYFMYLLYTEFLNLSKFQNPIKTCKTLKSMV